MANNPLSFDIIIAGGGLSGCLTALSLVNLTKANGEALSIAIVEANQTAAQLSSLNSSLNSNSDSASVNSTTNFDERVLALSHSTAQYFQTLGIWQALANFANPIETIHISDRGNYGKARIYAKQHQVTALGYVAPMKKIGEALLATLKPFKNVHWFCPDSIEHIEWQSESVNISLSSSLRLTGSLLLACVGANSVCRGFANIQSSQKAYQQSAVIANVKMRLPHENIAYERFTEYGPIAMLPLVDNHCSLVWTLTPQQAEKIAQCDNSQFINELNQAFGYWQGGVLETSERYIYPLYLVQAHENMYHRMALLGNASHTIHPIAGQGFNLGVRDVVQLSALIKKSLLANEDIGNFALLNEYSQQRQKDQRQVIQLTDSLVTLFSNELPPLVAGRNIALKALNYFSSFKQKFVHKTMGY